MDNQDAVIFGEASTGKVWIGEKELDISRSLQFENKSPSGFSWGYHGAGPAQLALAILLDLCKNPEIARRLFQEFKRDIIANFSSDADLVLPVVQVMKWLEDNSH
jgi:hypothetical protein